MIEKFEVIQNNHVSVLINLTAVCVVVTDRNEANLQRVLAWPGIEDSFHSLCENFSDEVTTPDVLQFMTPPGTKVFIN